MAESPRVVVGGVEVSVDHLIGGERLASDRTFECRSSLDWDHKLADVARGDAAAAERADERPRSMASPEWGALPVRGAGCRPAPAGGSHRGPQRRHRPEVETLDMGFLHRSMRERLVARGALNFRLYADMAEAHDEPRWPARGTAHTVQRMPAGPAVVITPWNAPFMLATWKVAPALAAGNSVVLKPAEWSPLSASLLADLTVEAGLPPGAFNLVQGIGAEVGAALTADRRVRRISFTGSPETARRIGAAAAANIVPFTAELGGKGPLIVFADCDLEAAAEQAAAQYEDSGQVCLAGTRLLVEASVRDQFMEALRVRTEAHVLGDSRDDSTTIAPMVHPDHLARVEGFVERARAAGDTVVWGGRRRAGSLHYEPTLIEPASNDSEDRPARGLRPGAHHPDVHYRIRGRGTWPIPPATDCRPSSTPAQPTGPSGSAAAVRAGIVWTNTFLVRDLAAPFGGCGLSGIGREGGDHALDFHSDLKTLILADNTTA